MIKIIISVMALFLAFVGYSQPHQDVLVGETGETLLQHLKTNYKPNNVLSYGDARNKMFGTVDNYNDSVTCVYTGDVIYLNPNEVPKNDAYSKGFNTEHTFPQSQGATGDAKSNVHHLFPTRVDVNGARGHLPFADIVDSQTDKWYFEDYVGNSIPFDNIDAYSELKTNDVFEPREVHKGNVARAMMYFYTMYKDQTTPGYFTAMIPTLCAWHYEDMIDQAEWDRTWAIAEFQDNKPNPFVLDCTLPERSYCANMGLTCVVGTDEISSIQLFDVLPNPAHTQAKMRFTLGVAFAKGEILVHDLVGKTVYTKTVHNLVAGPNEYMIDLTNWNPGVYIYSVQVNGAVKSGKLIVY